MPRWNGGVIGAANNPTSSSAKGIWSLSEATKAIRAGLWPPSNAGADPYFENVTLLLPGDGTNGAQNNTFLDSSTNNFTITRNGNTTQGTFSPFSKADGRWGVYFDGSGDYISVPRSTNFLPGANTDFTFEVWIFPTATPAGATNVVGLGEFGTNADWHLGVNSSLQLTLYLQSTTTTYTNSTQTLTLNQWNHIAASRSGTSSNNLKLFVNGVGQSFSTNASTVGTGTNDLTIAADNAGDEGNITGFLSNLRIVNGQGLYTANFTPATSPFTTTSEGATSTNVELLALQSNRFIDNSSNSATLSSFGNTAVSTFSPFPTLTAYAAGTNGGSGYFDGSGDYLTIPSDTAFNFGTGAFSVEFWVYITSLAENPSLINTNSTTIFYEVGGSNRGLCLFASSASQLTSATTVLPIGAWSHVVVCRNSSGNLSSFVNGTRLDTKTSNTSTIDFSGAIINRYFPSSGGHLFGYTSSLRLIKGSTPYDPTSTTITVPTAPVTNITNTSLLLNFTNGGIIDTSMSNDLETVGNAQISTTQSKFGGASMYFDGTGDYLVAAASASRSLGSGDFTVEMWIYPTAFATYVAVWSCTNSVSVANGFHIGFNSSGQMFVYQNSAFRISSSSTSGTLTLNQWNHLVLTRISGVVSFFVGGTQAASTWSTTQDFSQGFTLIGANPAGGSEYLTGYIDDLRVTKGYARYTANFTPPTGPFVGFGD